MLMMDVGVVRVAVPHGLVAVLVRVGLASAPVEVVGMLVVGIVSMAVRVYQKLMSVLMLVPLREVQPEARSHERGRGPERG